MALVFAMVMVMRMMMVFMMVRVLEFVSGVGVMAMSLIVMAVNVIVGLI